MVSELDKIRALRALLASPAKAKARNDEQDDLFKTEVAVPHSLPNVPSATQSDQAMPKPQMVKPEPASNVTHFKPIPSKQVDDLFNQTWDEAVSPIDANAMGFMATSMIYASLPYRAVKEVKNGKKVNAPLYERTSSSYSLYVMNHPKFGIPYGKIPRVVAAYLCTQAIRRKTKEIDLGKNFATFCERLGMHSVGGVNGSGTRIREMTLALITSRITISHQTNQRFDFNNMELAQKGTLFESLWTAPGIDCNDDSNKGKEWSSTLILSDAFYDNCIEHSCPVDLRVIHAMKSPMAIDIYIWLTYRFNAISAPTRISWSQLKFQFGNEYGDNDAGMKNFKSNFKRNLSVVLAAYREAKLTFDRDKDVLVLYPSRPHVIQYKG